MSSLEVILLILCSVGVGMLLGWEISWRKVMDLANLFLEEMKEDDEDVGCEDQRAD